MVHDDVSPSGSGASSCQHREHAAGSLPQQTGILSDSHLCQCNTMLFVLNPKVAVHCLQCNICPTGCDSTGGNGGGVLPGVGL